MIAYSPKVMALLDELDALPPPPKLSYTIGDECWIHAGLEDPDGKPRMSPGKIVFWFDLPDLAQRIYVVRLRDQEFMHLQNRDATVIAPTPEIGFPFTKTRHDNRERADDPEAPKDWRNS